MLQIALNPVALCRTSSCSRFGWLTEVTVTVVYDQALGSEGDWRITAIDVEEHRVTVENDPDMYERLDLDIKEYQSDFITDRVREAIEEDVADMPSRDRARYASAWSV